MEGDLTSGPYDQLESPQIHSQPTTYSLMCLTKASLDDTECHHNSDSINFGGKPVSVVSRFKDFSGRRRPVSSVSFQKNSKEIVAIAYCSSEFLGCHGEPSKEAHICDINHTAAPKMTLTSPG